MNELPVSTKTLRRRLADLLTGAMILSAKLECQERAEKEGEPIALAIGIQPCEEVIEVQRFVRSAAYEHAVGAFVAGEITLDDLARTLGPLQHMLPWLVNLKR